jgi:hypothetical protein
VIWALKSNENLASLVLSGYYRPCGAWVPRFLNTVACPNLKSITFDFWMEIKELQELFPYDETATVLCRRRSTVFSSVTDIVFRLKDSEKTVKFEEIKGI